MMATPSMRVGLQDEALRNGDGFRHLARQLLIHFVDVLFQLLDLRLQVGGLFLVEIGLGVVLGPGFLRLIIRFRQQILGRGQVLVVGIPGGLQIRGGLVHGRLEFRALLGLKGLGVLELRGGQFQGLVPLAQLPLRGAEVLVQLGDVIVEGLR